MGKSQMLHYSSIKSMLNVLNGQYWITATMKPVVDETCCIMTLMVMTELKCKHFVVVVMYALLFVSVVLANFNLILLCLTPIII